MDRVSRMFIKKRIYDDKIILNFLIIRYSVILYMDSVTGRNEATISVNVSVEHVKLVVVKFVLLFSPLRVIYDYTNGVGRGWLFRKRIV